MRNNKRIWILTLFVFCTMIGRADRAPVEHNFNDLVNTGKIEINKTRTTGTTSLLTYQCSGAVFGKDLINAPGSNVIAINFSSTEAMVTTTAVDSLAGLTVKYFYNSAKKPTIELRLSQDGSHWTNPLETVEFTDGEARYDIVPGKYYIRLTAKNSYQASIYSLSYSFGSSDCYLYIPE